MQHIPVVSHVLWMGGLLFWKRWTWSLLYNWLIPWTGRVFIYRGEEPPQNWRVGLSGGAPEVGRTMWMWGWNSKEGWTAPRCVTLEWSSLLSDTGRCAQLHVVQRIKGSQAREVSGRTLVPWYLGTFSTPEPGSSLIPTLPTPDPATPDRSPLTAQPSPWHLHLVMQWSPAVVPWRTDNMARRNDFTSSGTNDDL